MDGGGARPRFAEISTAFPTVPESVAAARRFVAVSLRRFEFSEDAIERAVYATSELVADAFATARPPIRLRVRAISDGKAAVEVTHGVDDAALDGADLPDDGLHLSPAGRTVLESMVSRWGSRPMGAGVMAWFEIEDDAASASGGTAATIARGG